MRFEVINARRLGITDDAAWAHSQLVLYYRPTNNIASPGLIEKY